MTVNATRAIQALGIRRPVRFHEKRLPGSMAAAANPGTPGLIVYDPVNMARGENAGWSPAEILAHELVHVRQIQDIGDPVEADRLYKHENRVRGYQHNRFEVQADELARVLAPLVEVSA